MSIVDSYDKWSKQIIGPENFYKENKIAEKCIVTFSLKVLNDVKERFILTEEVQSATANGKINIYSFDLNGEKILFYMSPIGSAISGCILDEVRFLTGATKFIFFGSCGMLVDTIRQTDVIIPTSAYRDEGFSYHYMEATDYITIKNSSKLEEIFNRLSISYVKGKTWTTDAIFRETENNTLKRKEDGCITVEMECAGLQAISNYRNIDLYIFFFGSDLVKPKGWDNISLGGDKEKIRQLNAFDIALMISKEIE